MTEGDQGDQAHQADQQEELCAAYPEVFTGATQWGYSDRRQFFGGIVCVTEDGLRGLLKFIKRTQRYFLDRITADPSSMTPDEMKLFGDTSSIWCEDDLVVSGLFVMGEPLRNERAEEGGCHRIDMPSPPSPTPPDEA